MEARVWRLLGSLGVAAMLLTFCFIPSAQAAPALFEKVRSLLEGKVGHDQMEMARFTLEYPEEAAIVFDHAASQDYPFFALVGAVKAAKDKTFPKLGKFDYAACTYPVTAIDSVFASADSKIDDAAGKNDTNTAVGMARTYSAEAAKQGTKAAQDQINQQLIASVPYFGQIKAICTFAFHTEFDTERNLQNAANDTARKVREAYDELSSGDVVGGAATIISLGVSPAAACDLIDTQVSGGLIGRTPLLGDLANGLCKSFAGKVIDGLHGIVHGGLGAIETVGGYAYSSVKEAYCDVKSWFGGECATDPPPPTAESQGDAFCADHSGSASIWAPTHDPNYFKIYCVDGVELFVKPGAPPEVTTPAQRAAALAAIKAVIDAEFAKNINQLKTEWQTTYLAQCPKSDVSCGVQVGQLLQQAVFAAQAEHSKSPFDSFNVVKLHAGVFEATWKADDAVEAAKFRTGPDEWAAAYLAFWNPQCEDNTCRTALDVETYGIRLSIAQTHATKYYPYDKLTLGLFAEAAGVAQTLVAESSARSVEFNKKTTAEAGAAWQIITNALWGKKCADTQCVAEVHDLSAKMKLAAGLVQMGQPDISSLQVQGIVVSE